MIEEAKRQYAAGSIITLMWHAVRPVDDEPNDWRRSVQGKLTDAYSGYPQSHHDELAALAQGKPIALGEVGTAPTPAILKQQPMWAWFMIWTDFFDNNKREDLLELFKDPHTLSRGDPLPAGK